MVNIVFRDAFRALRFIWRKALLIVLLWLLLMIINYYYVHIKADFIDVLSSIGLRGYLDTIEIVNMIVLLFILSIVCDVINFVSEYLLQSIGPQVYRILASMFAEKLIRIRPYRLLSSGDVIARFVSDLEPLSEILGGLVIAIIIQVLRAAIGTYILYSLSPHLTLITLITLPIYLVVFKLGSKKVSSASEKERVAMSNLVESVKMITDGISFIKRTSSEKYFKKIFAESLCSRINRLLKLIFIKELLHRSFYSLEKYLSLILLTIGGYFVYLGYTTIGSVIAFIGAVYNVYEPTYSLSQLLTNVSLYEPYLTRFYEVLGIEEEEDIGRELSKIKSIELKNVYFRVLKEVSLEIKEGESIGIIGPTGSGKTTLLLLLLRLYEPEKGKVLINGVDYKEYKVLSLRRRIYYLPPEDFFFKGPLIDNLTLGKHIDRRKIRRVLEISKADFVHDISGELDPEKLSTGEKQRLALARALLFEPDVLILDEALDAVDSITEEAILKELKNIFREKILIIVSHRSSALKHVDKIYVIEDGKIIDKGSHKDLLKKCKLYKNILLKQNAN